MTRRNRRPLAVSLVSLVLAGLVAGFAPPSSGADGLGVQARKAAPYSATKKLTRVFANADGTTYDFPSNDVTVNVSQTENLRGRQRVLVSWTGAQPSGGRASNPYGADGLQQEYPVMIMQCRGVDDPSLPPAKQLQPQTCWTSTFSQRSEVARGETEAAWTRDLLAPDTDRERISGLEPFPTADDCPTADTEPYFTHLTPFVTAKGKTFVACDRDHMPPEAAADSAFPPAEVVAFTDADGSGSVQFEVRSEVENESLGCSDKVACSIVVLPMNGLSCAAPSSPPTRADNACRKGGSFLPGSSNFLGTSVDQAVGPSLWWSASNWANRFSVPITFGLPPDTCDILDSRAPTGFYGSELLAQASLQWSPAYCLDKKRFKFQHNQMSDDAGWNNMENGVGSAALVSSKHKRRGTDPVAYAPTAVTGFGVGYVVDKPDNGGEVTDLRLNARLVAKLLTQSYPGSDAGKQHPGLGDNPLAIMQDPEFIELNPHLSTIAQEAGATLLSLSNSSDVVEQLTEWIAEDKDAMAFIGGKPDKWGMKVNPSYKKISLPRPEWPLLDSFIPTTQDQCRQANPAVYLNQVAAPVTTMRKIAEAILDGWPNVQTKCELDVGTGLYKVGRVNRQAFGSRFVLGLVSLGDMDRYGLRGAALQTKDGSYVEPSDASLAAALKLTKQPKEGEPFVLDQADVRKSKTAYPGTMVVYTAAKTANLAQEEADKVAQFIRISTSEGQKPGFGNGELPGGFLPIEKTGVTSALFASAQKAATAVAKQEAPPTGSASPSTSPPDGGGGDGGTTTPIPPAPTSDDPATAAPSASPSASPTASPSAELVAMPKTQAVSTDMGGRLLPGLLVIGLLGVAVASAVRFFLQPPPGPRP